MERSHYNEIQFTWGSDLLTCIKRLKECPLLSRGTFNGKEIYSDETEDEIYIKVTGHTKSGLKKKQQEARSRITKEKQEHLDAVPALTLKYEQEGEALLEKEYHDLWKKVVPRRLNDLYQGMELRCCLDIIEPLVMDRDFKRAEKILNGQDHSGMSYGLVLNMVKELCSVGTEFVDYIKKGEKLNEKD